MLKYISTVVDLIRIKEFKIKEWMDTEQMFIQSKINYWLQLVTENSISTLQLGQYTMPQEEVKKRKKHFPMAGFEPQPHCKRGWAP